MKVQIIPTTFADYPIIQNMGRFYVYDRSAYMGWECPENGLFECIDFKHYFEDPDKKAYLIRIQGEIAGFILLDKMHLISVTDWNIGEFFILTKFQGKGVASAVVSEIFKKYQGRWSIAVMPENIKAVKFWRKIISQVNGGIYYEVFKTANELKTTENPNPHSMIVFTFEVRG